MSDEKPQTKMEWMKEQLAEDDYHPTERAINSVLNGAPSPNLEDDLVQYIEELESVWNTN